MNANTKNSEDGIATTLRIWAIVSGQRDGKLTLDLGGRDFGGEQVTIPIPEGVNAEFGDRICIELPARLISIRRANKTEPEQRVTHYFNDRPIGSTLDRK